MKKIVYNLDIETCSANEIVEKSGISRFPDDQLKAAFAEAMDLIEFAWKNGDNSKREAAQLQAAPFAFECYRRFYGNGEKQPEFFRIIPMPKEKLDTIHFWLYPAATSLLLEQINKDKFYYEKEAEMPAPKGHAPYPGCETGGRPRRYSNEDIDRFADDLIVWIKKDGNYWLKDFCLEKLIDPKYMSVWADENEKFRDAYNLSKAFQESRIFKGAMIEAFNTGMSKFALINNHGWVDKSETKLSGDATNPLQFVLESIDGKTKGLVNESD